MIANPNVKSIIEVEDMNTFEEKLHQQFKTEKKTTIVFKDISNQYLYSDIPLSLLYNQCTSLNLNLKGFKSDQIDFDEFTKRLLLFKNLTNFSLRFYNKRVQNLDMLFCNVQNIQNVSLNLKNFRKIKLEKEYIKSPCIIKLSLNLTNTTFNSAKDEMKLIEFLSSLENLQELSLKIHKRNQFKFMKGVSKQTKILLNLISEVIDIPFCDSLVEFVKDNDLEGIQISQIKPILSIYLEDKGIKVINPFVISQHMNITPFKPNDFKMLKQVPQFIQRIINLSKIQDKPISNISMHGQQSQQKDCFDYIIPFIDHHFNQITCSFYNYTSKQNNSWSIDTYNINSNIICNLVNLTIRISYNINIDQGLQIMRSLRQSDYLISLQLQDPTYNYAYLQQPFLETYKQLLSLISNQISLLQDKALTKLRYFVFKKTIFDLIPIPDQIFYDLIEI